MTKELPKKISPDPIVDSVVELRFDNAVPSEAVFGMVFSRLENEFRQFRSLPITQVPIEIRERDPNLRFLPTHEARSGNYVFKVGARVLSLSNPDEYLGWSSFSKQLNTVLEAVRDSGVVGEFIRLGIRYIDFFELDIFEKVKLDITADGKPFEAKQKVFNALVNNGKFETNLRVANNISIDVRGITKSGSVIDADTFCDFSDGPSFENVFGFIDDCHLAAKSIFFSLLREEFISTLNPEY
jgi:uncharacterized protein (TIGR04255 family)